MSNEELAVLVQQGERDRILELWEQVRPLVTKLAWKRYRATDGFGGVTPEDLTQAGFLGFLAAVDAFDPESGYGFTTYLSGHLKNAFSEAGHIRSKKRSLDRLNWCDSLNRQVDESGEGGGTLEMSLADPTAAQAFEDAERREFSRELRIVLERAIERLSDNERTVIVGLYFDGKSTAELAEECGVSPNAIRYREHGALRAIRRSAGALLSAYLHE